MSDEEPKKKRCPTCMNFVYYCRCQLPHDLCQVHNMPEGRRPASPGQACMCDSVIGPQFQCECCEQYNVVVKSPGFGYLCDGCIETCIDEDWVVSRIAHGIERKWNGH